MIVSPSASVAETAEPMSTPEPVFSAIERLVLTPSVNSGTLFVGVSSIFVMFIVTDIESLPPLPSETDTVTA